MSRIESPFQMKHNKVVNFIINQNDDVKEFENTKVSIDIDFKVSQVCKKDDYYNADLNVITKLNAITNNEEKYFEISLDMKGIFEGDSNELQKEKFIEMVKLNGVSTIIQLSRAFITSATALAGFLQPVNFPMINVIELNKYKEKKSDNNDLN